MKNNVNNANKHENILEINNLTKSYGDFTLKNVSFSLPRGYIMGLIGPNGAGKTTIIKSIMHLLNKDSGDIKIFGQDHLEHEVEIKERIGFVYDNPTFYEHLNLIKMKKMIAPFYKQWDEECFNRLLEDFELPPKRRIKELSRGMRMKYALAIALSHHAELIIMDEPTSGLDPVFRRELLDILGGLMEDESRSILFSTHITSDLEKIADYITFIHKGNVEFSCSKDEVLDKWGIVKGGNNWLTRENEQLFKGIRRNRYGFEGLTHDIKSMEREYKGELVYEKASLEDIMYFTAKG